MGLSFFDQHLTNICPTFGGSAFGPTLLQRLISYTYHRKNKLGKIGAIKMAQKRSKDMVRINAKEVEKIMITLVLVLIGIAIFTIL